MHTDDNLQRRGCSLVSICTLCKAHLETSEHLYLSCPFVIPIWQWLSSVFPIQFNLSSIADILKACNFH
ncbi:unnamed protein product [Lupinus luteus]|uniref:Reverse transcriptase zinc-binding domain-containing protein n=1 Tax=Lupinus luteus TaxID=3873 RepID=A0AAV1XXP8_LUPLU